MKIHFNPQTKALVISAEDTTEAMALLYWEGEFAKHGEKVLEVVTDVPYRLPSPADD